MRVLRSYENLPTEARGSVVAIGNFDGIHRGHHGVIDKARHCAESLGAPLAIMTFEPHPRSFFAPGAEPFRLSSALTKEIVLRSMKVDLLFTLTFDAAFARQSAEEFASRVLADGLRVKCCVVGHDFNFGKARQGNTDLLRAYGRTYGFDVQILEAVGSDAQIFSSTLVRQLLTTGEPRKAADILGHFWTIDGVVTTGDQRGRSIGFPTANIALGDYLRPKVGVYAIRAALHEIGQDPVWVDGIANFGRRPTFDKKDLLLEAHLFDFTGDLYGKRLLIQFIDYIRPEQKFPGIEALKARIVADTTAARRILADMPKPAST